MRVCYYVSGHGLGHASRALQVMEAFPPDAEIFVKSMAPPEFFRHNLSRRIHLYREQFDVGTWQRSNMEIDWARTVDESVRVHREAEAQVEREVDWVRKQHIDAIVVDVPPLPLRVAAQAGIPGIAIVNFTWVEILAAISRRNAHAAELRHSYRDDYRRATLALRTPMSLNLPHFKQMKDIPLIARRGRDILKELRHYLNVKREDRLVLLYFGNWPDAGKYDRLAHFHHVRFISFLPMGPHVARLDPRQWSFPDVLSSCDAVIAKPGYGTIGECMANGTPVVYYPRPEFAEYAAIRADMNAWGGAVQISTRDFIETRWSRALEQAFALTPSRADSSGAKVAAREITKAARNHGHETDQRR